MAISLNWEKKEVTVQIVADRKRLSIKVAQNFNR